MTTLKITPISSAKQSEGVVAEYHGVKLIIARAGQNYSAALAKAMRPHRREITKGTLSEDAAASVLAKVISEHLIKGWTDFVIEDKEVKYSKAVAVQLMLEDPDCREFVLDFASDMTNYLEDEIENTAGKSQSSSDAQS